MGSFYGEMKTVYLDTEKLVPEIKCKGSKLCELDGEAPGAVPARISSGKSISVFERAVHVGKTSRWKAKVYCRCDEEELQEAPGPRILDKGELDASLNSTAADVNQNDDTIAVVDGGDRIFIYANEPGGPRFIKEVSFFLAGDGGRSLMKIGNIRWSPSTEKILAVALEDRNLVILYRPGEDKHKASGSERHIIDEDGSSDSAITVKNNSEVPTYLTFSNDGTVLAVASSTKKIRFFIASGVGYADRHCFKSFIPDIDKLPATISSISFLGVRVDQTLLDIGLLVGFNGNSTLCVYDLYANMKHTQVIVREGRKGLTAGEECCDVAHSAYHNLLLILSVVKSSIVFTQIHNHELYTNMAYSSALDIISSKSMTKYKSQNHLSFDSLFEISIGPNPLELSFLPSEVSIDILVFFRDKTLVNYNLPIYDLTALRSNFKYNGNLHEAVLDEVHTEHSSSSSSNCYPLNLKRELGILFTPTQYHSVAAEDAPVLEDGHANGSILSPNNLQVAGSNNTHIDCEVGRSIQKKSSTHVEMNKTVLVIDTRERYPNSNPPLVASSTPESSGPSGSLENSEANASFEHSASTKPQTSSPSIKSPCNYKAPLSLNLLKLASELPSQPNDGGAGTTSEPANLSKTSSRSLGLAMDNSDTNSTTPTTDPTPSNMATVQMSPYGHLSTTPSTQSSPPSKPSTSSDAQSKLAAKPSSKATGVKYSTPSEVQTEKNIKNPQICAYKAQSVISNKSAKLGAKIQSVDIQHTFKRHSELSTLAPGSNTSHTRAQVPFPPPHSTQKLPQSSLDTEGTKVAPKKKGYSVTKASKEVVPPTPPPAAKTAESRGLAEEAAKLRDEVKASLEQMVQETVETTFKKSADDVMRKSLRDVIEKSVQPSIIEMVRQIRIIISTEVENAIKQAYQDRKTDANKDSDTAEGPGARGYQKVHRSAPDTLFIKPKNPSTTPPLAWPQQIQAQQPKPNTSSSAFNGHSADSSTPDYPSNRVKRCIANFIKLREYGLAYRIAMNSGNNSELYLQQVFKNIDNPRGFLGAVCTNLETLGVLAHKYNIISKKGFISPYTEWNKAFKVIRKGLENRREEQTRSQTRVNKNSDKSPKYGRSNSSIRLRKGVDM